MGEIVFWTLIRILFYIPIIWILKSYLDFSVWLITALFVLYGAVIYPAFLSYRKFEEKNKSIYESSLCTSCKHFDRSAVLCIKHDEHPTQNYLPCKGFSWESKTYNE